MSSAGVTLSGPKDYWKGTDYVERKLLDLKVASSTKQVLLDRIEFKEASKPDPFYTELKNQYTPINNSSNKQQGRKALIANGKKGSFESANKVKDELPTPQYILFEREKIHLNWKSTRKIGPGLFNLGNTCFLNSVIQVLTYTPPLVNYLTTQEHSRTCKAVGFCMLCELQRHVLRTFGHNQNDAIKPMAIIQKLKYIAKHLRFGHQEDSHEFLRYVIDGIMKSCLAGVPEKLDTYTKGTTMIHHVFGGYYRSQVTCERCHHVSSTYDPLMEVLLDIKQSHSVQKALHRLTSVELLSGDNMYLCPRCKRKVPAKKHLTVHTPPNVLTMCLKRFDCHSLFSSKVNKVVNYPEHLNLRPFMSKNQGSSVDYKLYAVLVHSGYSCNSGHYFCFVKSPNNTWYQMNDSTVRQVGLKSVLSQQAYLLFYIKHQQAQKEKPNHVPQHAQSQSINGVKSWKSESFIKKNIPKVIGEDMKCATNALIGQPVPRKRDVSVIKTETTNKQVAPVATILSETREKISFTLNHIQSQKKQVGSTTTDKKTLVESKQPNVSSGTSTSSDNTLLCPAEKVVGKVVEKVVGKVEVNDGVEEKHETEQENIVKQDEVVSAAEQSSKELNEEDKSDIHATTRWNVTPANTGPPAGLGSSRERTPSLSSDISNACSIASKTGDWAVTDRSTTADVCPRLPERQHAGWDVSTTEDAVSEKENGDETKNEVETQENVEKTEEDVEKTEEDVEKTEEDVEKTREDVEHKKSKKRKHSKEKSESDSKFRKADDETRLLSDERRESSGNDEVRARHHKKRKKSKKVKKTKSSTSDSDGDSSSERREHERRKKGHKKSKKKKKKKRKSSSETGDHDSEEEAKLSSKQENKRDRSRSKVEEKAKELISKVVDVTKKLCRPLVQYSDHSSSGDDESTGGNKGDINGSSRSNEEHDKHSRENTKSRSCEEYSNASGRCHDNHDRKHVVDMLLEKSRGVSNYGCQVERWDNERDVRVDGDARVKNLGETAKRRRDRWDEEYDQGKVKRGKGKESFLNRSYPGHNLFQREYDKKRMRDDGWHYSPSSASRWHNRSSDRHSRRDRR